MTLCCGFLPRSILFTLAESMFSSSYVFAQKLKLQVESQAWGYSLFLLSVSCFLVWVLAKVDSFCTLTESMFSSFLCFCSKIDAPKLNLESVVKWQLKGFGVSVCRNAHLKLILMFVCSNSIVSISLIFIVFAQVVTSYWNKVDIVGVEP